ncbi:hypothetical protein [Burkholderia cepacia]|uniref:hypothetical protein n=1 Tax=Burkholderia cepacia TaxID=292 RepID=UPI002FE295E0
MLLLRSASICRAFALPMSVFAGRLPGSIARTLSAVAMALSYWPRDRSPCARFSRPSTAGDAGLAAVDGRTGGAGRGLLRDASATAAGAAGAGASSCSFAKGDVCCAFADAGGVLDAFDAGGVAGTEAVATFVTTAGPDAGEVAAAAAVAVSIGADAGVSAGVVATTALAMTVPAPVMSDAALAGTAGTVDAATGSGIAGALAWRPCHQNAPPAQATATATPAAMILSFADVSSFVGAGCAIGRDTTPDTGRMGSVSGAGAVSVSGTSRGSATVSTAIVSSAASAASVLADAPAGPDCPSVATGETCDAATVSPRWSAAAFDVTVAATPCDGSGALARPDSASAMFATCGVSFGAVFDAGDSTPMSCAGA